MHAPALEPNLRRHKKVMPTLNHSRAVAFAMILALAVMLLCGPVKKRAPRDRRPPRKTHKNRFASISDQQPSTLFLPLELLNV